jgi:replicative DNA helicase
MTTDTQPKEALELVTEESAFTALEAEMILAAVAMRDEHTFADRGIFLDENTAGFFYRKNRDEPGLSERLYRAGLIREGNDHKYQTKDAIKDYLNLSDMELAPYLKYLNRPAHVVSAAVERIKEAAQRRMLERQLKQALRQIAEKDQTVETVISSTMSNVSGVAVLSKHPGETAADLALGYGKANEWDRFPEPFIYRSAHPLDKMPFMLGSYNIIVAPPHTGKTVLAWWRARELAEKGGRVLWLGYEMTGTDILDMEITRMTGIPYTKLLNAREGIRVGEDSQRAKLSDRDEKARDEALAKIGSTWGPNVRFLSGGHAVAMNELPSIVRRLRTKGMLDMLVVDHLNIARVNDERGMPIQNEVTRTTEASRICREIVETTGTPILANAQFNRSRKEATTEEKGPDQFTMEMLRGSGALENDAYGITACQIVQSSEGGGRLIRWRKGDPIIPGMRLALLGQILKNRKAGGLCSTWIAPLAEADKDNNPRFDYDLALLRKWHTSGRHGVQLPDDSNYTGTMEDTTPEYHNQEAF